MPKVLLVDDEVQVTNALRRLFRREGFEVQTANRGAEALALLPGFAPDVVISDFRMPEMNGAELLAQVRAQLPVAVRLMLSGYADLTSIVASVNEGEVCRFLTKPWEDDALVAKVRELLEQRRVLAELYAPFSSAAQARLLHHESSAEVRVDLGNAGLDGARVGELIAKFAGVLGERELTMVSGLLQRRGARVSLTVEIGGARQLSVTLPFEASTAPAVDAV